MTKWPPDQGPYRSLPEDFDEAIEGYRKFTKFDPQEVGILEGLIIPSKLMQIGTAIQVLYRSDKWEDKNHDYFHDHDPGVKVYIPTTSMIDRGPLVEVPSWLKKVTTVYLLGTCLGFRYKDSRGKRMDATTKPYPELYAIPSGRALLVLEVHGPTAKIAAAMWGGSLDVKPEGIVG